MKITNNKTVLDTLTQNPTALIFGFDKENDKWVRVQHMTVEEILTSSYAFYMLSQGLSDIEDTEFLILLANQNYGRHLVDYRKQ